MPIVLVEDCGRFVRGFKRLTLLVVEGKYAGTQKSPIVSGSKYPENSIDRIAEIGYGKNILRYPKSRKSFRE